MATSFNKNFLYDLKLGELGEKLINNILSNKTLEVKTDFLATKTQNLFIEYQSRNKPSGIATSKADYYCFVISNNKIIIIQTAELKQLCRKYLNSSRDVKGGDDNTSKGILLPMKELVS